MSIQAINTALPQQVRSETSAVSREPRVVVPDQERAQPAQSTQPISQEQLKAAVNSVREYIQPLNNNLEFSVIADTKQVVVKVVDSVTKEVIRQIPSEEMIALAKALDSIKGLFVKQQA